MPAEGANPTVRTAQALALDLGRYLRGEPILARPTSVWERAGKWAKRRPGAAAALAFSIVAFLGILGGVFIHQRNSFLWSLHQEQNGNRLIGQASKARDRDELTREKTNLSNFLGALPAKTEFDELRSRVAIELSRVDGRIDELLTREAASSRKQAERSRFQKFRALRKQAELYAVWMAVIEPLEYQSSRRAAALAALAVYAQDPTAPAAAWSLEHALSDALTQAEQAEVAGGCFDLLLILSDALEPAEGLKILDCAARLRPEPTAAYHLRRAAVLFQSGDKAGRAREEQVARGLHASTALDYLLIGREQLAREQFREALRSAQSAIGLDPDQLGGYLILAVGYFNTQRYSQAMTSLNTCIQNAPELPGLYLFRALVSGEVGNRALFAISETPARAAEWRLEAAESFAAAAEDYRHAVERRPGPDLRYVLLVNRGGMYLQAGRREDALADAEAAIALNPKPYHAHALMAQICQQEGRTEQAAQALDRAIERQPDRPELFRARACSLPRPVKGKRTYPVV